MKKSFVFVAVFLLVFLVLPGLILPFVTQHTGLNIGEIELVLIAVVFGVLAYFVARSAARAIDDADK
ncbi:hypothetical protein [Corynebacterium epidermidicanis]|nr:hypothetical protein [Corynebacterium epidermidicanis]